MTHPNLAYAEAVRTYEPRLLKFDSKTDMREKALLFLAIAKSARGRAITMDEKILDFGCGGGHFCKALWALGYKASGVDIFEYWGCDSSLLGEVGAELQAEETRNLYKIDMRTNALPFDTASIDIIISDQTLEHVFDYRSVFAEQARVLKKGAIAIHRFPHGHTLREPHTKIPITLLARHKLYLAIFALVGFRTQRQRGLSIQQVLACNILILDSVNYKSKAHIIAEATNLDVDLTFIDGLEHGNHRAARIYRILRTCGMGSIARPILSFFQNNRILILRKK